MSEPNKYRDTPNNYIRKYRDINGLLKHNSAYRDRIKNMFRAGHNKFQSVVEKDSYGLINDSKQRLINNINNKKNINPLGGFMDGLGLYPPALALDQYKNKVRFYDLLLLLQDIYIDVTNKKNKKSTYYYWIYNLPTDANFVKSLTSMMGLLVNNQSILDKRILDYPFKDKAGATKQYLNLWKAYSRSIIPKNIVQGLQSFLSWTAKDSGLKTGTYTKQKLAKAQQYIKAKKQLWDLYDSIPAVRFIVKERSRAGYLPIIYLGMIIKIYKTGNMENFKKAVAKYRAFIVGMWLSYPLSVIKMILKAALKTKDDKVVTNFYNQVKQLALPSAVKKKVAKKNYVELTSTALSSYVAKLPTLTPGSSTRPKIDSAMVKEAINKSYTIIKPFLTKIKDKDFTKFIMNVIATIYKKIGVKNMRYWGTFVKRILISAKSKQMASQAVLNVSKVLAESTLEGNQLLLAVMDQLARTPKNILKNEKAFNSFANAVWVVTAKNPKNKIAQDNAFSILKEARLKLMATLKQKPKGKKKQKKQGARIKQPKQQSVSGLGWTKGCRKKGLGECGNCSNPYCPYGGPRRRRGLGSCSCSNTSRSVGDLSDTYNIFCDDYILWNPEDGKLYHPKKKSQRKWKGQRTGRRKPTQSPRPRGKGRRGGRTGQPQMQTTPDPKTIQRYDTVSAPSSGSTTPGIKTDNISQMTA